MNWLIIGSGSDTRVQKFQHALAAAGLAPARVVAYTEDWQTVLPEWLTPSTFLRIEAPNRLADVRCLMKKGFNGATSAGLTAYCDALVDNSTLENGEFFAPHQFYFGLKSKLQQLYELIQQKPIAGTMNHIPDVVTFFDKQHCHQQLNNHGIPLPSALYDVSSYNDLREKMREGDLNNVFIKTRFGSGASGIIALKTNGSKVQSLTTVEQANGRLYNTRNLQRCANEVDVGALIDRLCQWGVQCESWVPKATIKEKQSDCRILLVDGAPDFIVLRKSKTPITNLHLMNERAKIDELIVRAGNDTWQRVLNTCDKIAGIFPKSFQIALDITVHRNLRNHSVLELNAFGDFLQNIKHQGMGTHAWQLQKFLDIHGKAGNN